MTVKLKTPSNGSVSLTPQDTAADVVLTVPATTGVVNTSGVVNQVPAGSASAPSVYPTGDANTGLFFPAADTVAVATGGAEAMRLDSSGNLLVGTTSGGIGKVRIDGDAGGVNLFVNHSGQADSVRIDANTGGAAGQAVYVLPIRTAGTLRGGVQWNGSNLLYNTSSDYRLKENVQPLVGALERVTKLNPVTYTWKESGIASEGFIAHELQAVVPDCVTGEKDEVDADGKPVYQGIDTSFLVATLTAAIQEQQAIINSLQDRITALENA